MVRMRGLEPPRT